MQLLLLLLLLVVVVVVSSGYFSMLGSGIATERYFKADVDDMMGIYNVNKEGLFREVDMMINKQVV